MHDFENKSAFWKWKRTLKMKAWFETKSLEPFDTTSQSHILTFLRCKMLNITHHLNFKFIKNKESLAACKKLPGNLLLFCWKKTRFEQECYRCSKSCAFWAASHSGTPCWWTPLLTVKLQSAVQALVLYNRYNGGVAQKAGNRGVWPKKQVNKPLLKPATFCRTLCRGQKFEILQNPLAPWLQSVWGRPMQNSQSKRCCLGDHIPSWKERELCGTYGINEYSQNIGLQVFCKSNLSFRVKKVKENYKENLVNFKCTMVEASKKKSDVDNQGYTRSSHNAILGTSLQS